MRFKFIVLLLLSCGPAVFAAELDFAAIQKRIEELQPKPSEKRFDQIGWAKDIRDALQLAQRHDRPVFLFTHDGRMNIGRC